MRPVLASYVNGTQVTQRVTSKPELLARAGTWDLLANRRRRSFRKWQTSF
jgi:hypothetical protein